MLKFPRKKSVYILGSVLLSLIIFVELIIILIPSMSTYAFKYWLEKQNLQGEIDHIGLALKTGTVTFKDVKIADGDNTLLSVGKLRFSIRLGDLFDHKLTIQDLELNNTRLEIQQDGDALTVAGIGNQQEQVEPNEPATQSPHEESQWTISLGTVQITNLETCLSRANPDKPFKVCNQLGEFAWKGDIKLDTRNPQQVHATGAVVINNLAALDQVNQFPLARFASLNIANLRVDSLDKIQFETLELQQLAVLQTPDKDVDKLLVFGTDKLRVDTISLQKLASLEIATITIENPTTNVRLNTDNSVTPFDELNNIRFAAAAVPAEKNGTPEKHDEQNSFQFRIGKLNVSTLKTWTLMDNHVRPVVTHRVSQFALAMNDIDSSKPKQASELAMNFNYGEYGKIKINGSVIMFTAKPSANLKATIVGIDLNAVSPYLRKLLQHTVKSGQLDAQVAVKINQGKLDSNAKLTLHKFYVKQLDEHQQDKYQKSLGMPLSSALSLLRDGNDSIQIDLPITGDIQNPDFSINDIISTVSAKAIKVAVVNYYASLGLVSLVGGAIDLLTTLHFDPVVFTPGQSKLTKASIGKLSKFATMLRDRPQVHLVVCGYATQADRIKLFASKNSATEIAGQSTDSKIPPPNVQQIRKLNNLARPRGNAVKQYLVKQEHVAADRLILCNPEYVTGNEHAPYTDLHI